MNYIFIIHKDNFVSKCTLNFVVCCCCHFQLSLRSHKLIRATPEMFINKMWLQFASVPSLGGFVILLHFILLKSTLLHDVEAGWASDPGLRRPFKCYQFPVLSWNVGNMPGLSPLRGLSHPRPRNRFGVSLSLELYLLHLTGENIWILLIISCAFTTRKKTGYRERAD